MSQGFAGSKRAVPLLHLEQLALPGSRDFRWTVAMMILVSVIAAGIGHDVFFNSLVTPQGSDPLGALLGYLRVFVSGLIFVLIVLTWGLDWALPRIPLLFLPFVAYALASCTWSGHMTQTLQNATSLLTLWLCMSLLVQRAGALGTVYASLYLGAAVVIVSAALALFLPQIGQHNASDALQFDHAGRWRGIFIHKNVLGPWAAYTSVTFFTHIKLIKRPNMLFWWVARISALACLIFSGSITALLLALTLLAIWVVLRASQVMSWAAVLLSLLLVTALAVSMISAVDFDILGLFGRDSSLTGRSDIWDFALSYMWDHNFLRGEGFMASGGDDYMTRISILLQQPIPGAESGYLTLLLDMGLIGFLLFIIPYLISIRSALRWLRFLRGDDRQCLEFMLMLLIGALVFAVSESSAFIANSLDGIIFLAPMYYLMTLPRSPARLLITRSNTAASMGSLS